MSSYVTIAGSAYKTRPELEILAPDGTKVPVLSTVYTSAPEDTVQLVHETVVMSPNSPCGFWNPRYELPYRAKPGVDYGAHGWTYVKMYYTDNCWVPSSDTATLERLQKENQMGVFQYAAYCVNNFATNLIMYCTDKRSSDG